MRGVVHEYLLGINKNGQFYLLAVNKIEVIYILAINK